jgi:ApaG protein
MYFTFNTQNMVAAITHGIYVGIETFYQREMSHPQHNEFVFAYRVTIRNESLYTVQLLRRHWHIFDACGEWREVEGEGVVGLQPVLNPNDSYIYVSGCHLQSDMGAMHGTYTLQREADNTAFIVNIPRFELVATTRLN